jgi:hypothetical protein
MGPQFFCKNKCKKGKDLNCMKTKIDHQLNGCYDKQHNDTQHNDIQHNDIQHNDIQHNDNQNKGLKCDTQHKNIAKQHCH